MSTDDQTALLREIRDILARESEETRRLWADQRRFSALHAVMWWTYAALQVALLVYLFMRA